MVGSICGVLLWTPRLRGIEASIRAILFDLGRVIVPFDFRRGYERLEKRCGIPAAEIPLRIGETDLVRRFEKGQMGAEEFVGALSTHLGLHISYPEFCGIWTSRFLPHTLVPESLIQALAANYRMLLLSNTNPIHFKMIRETYPLLRHFHAFVLSHEAGSMKPEPEIYRKAVEASGCFAGGVLLHGRCGGICRGSAGGGDRRGAVRELGSTATGAEGSGCGMDRRNKVRIAIARNSMTTGSIRWR